MMKFTQEQVRKQHAAIKSGELDRLDSPVYQAWADMAEEWVMDADCIPNGFRGWFQRSVTHILLDFHLNDRLTDALTTEQFDQYMDEKNGDEIAVLENPLTEEELAGIMDEDNGFSVVVSVDFNELMEAGGDTMDGLNDLVEELIVGGYAVLGDLSYRVVGHKTGTTEDAGSVLIEVSAIAEFLDVDPDEITEEA